MLDYLVDEVLEVQPQAVQEFLLTTAVLPRFNAGLAAAVTGQDDVTCARIIAQLRRDNLFVIDLDDEDDWHRYHHQFQYTLLSRLQMHVAPQQIATWRHKAANWFEAHGLPEDAFVLLAGLEAWAQAAALIERTLPRLQREEQWGQLGQWLDAVPPAWADQSPALLVARAWVMNLRSDSAAITSLAARAEMLAAELMGEDPQPGTNAQVLSGQIAALRSAYAAGKLPVERRLEYAYAALALLPAEYDWVRGYAHIQLSQNLIETGRVEEAFQELRNAIGEVGPGSAGLAVRLHQALVFLLVISGRLEEAQPAAARFLLLAEARNMPVSIAWAKTALGMLAFQRGDFAAAQPLLVAATDYRQPANFNCRAIALDSLVQLCAFQGEFAAVSASLHGLHDHVAAQQRPQQLAVIEAYIAYIDLVHGKLVAADVQAFSQRMPAAAIAAAPPFVALPVIRLLIAAAAEPALDTALAALQAQVAMCRRTHNVNYLVQLSILLAITHWARHEPEAALAALEPAVTLGYHSGYRWSFFVHGPEMARLLHELAGTGRCREEAGALLAAFPAPERQPSIRAVNHSLAAQKVIEPLTNREIEILDLLRLRLANKEIAYKLNISPFTVRNLTTNIYAKLNVHSRSEAVQRAQELGLLRPD